MTLREQYPNTYAEFDKYGASVVKEMRTRLFNNGSIASETLYNSLDYEIIDDKKGFELAFLLEDYYVYVDKGRRPGKFPPLKNIREWTRLKGIPESATYPIAKKIAEEGIRPTNFYTISTTRREKQFLTQVNKAMAKDIGLFFKQEFKR